MNQDNLPRSSWYAPAQTPEAQAAPARKQKRKVHTGVKIASITLCVLLLIAASVYLFSGEEGRLWSFRRDDSDTGHSFSFEIPGTEAADPADETEPDERPNAPGEYDDDYKDFFSRYFTVEPQTSKDEASSVSRAEPGTEFRILLASAASREELSLQALYADCVQSVVGIRASSRGQMGYFWGTGIIMSEDGLILTNQHIIAGTDKAVVILPDGTEHSALLIGEDTQMDIAVLQIDATGLHAAEFGDSSALSVGDGVVAIGNPLTDSLSGTMTNGIISAIDRSVSNNGHPMTLLQTNAALNEGNSGGPLFNMYGQVIGITNMKMSNPFSDVAVEGLGFAIPSSTVKVVTDQLLATGRYVRPGIGITVGAISAEDAAHYELPEGLYISAVSPDSDAAAKGVQPGDILTHVNGIPVRKTDDVLSIRDAMQIGETMTMTLFRAGEIFDVEIELFDLSKLY